MRMSTSKSVEVANASGADAVVREIAKAENKFQEELNRAFVQLAEGSFKGLRRQLPVTRQRVEWEKIGGYRVCVVPLKFSMVHLLTGSIARPGHRRWPLQVRVRNRKRACSLCTYGRCPSSHHHCTPSEIQNAFMSPLPLIQVFTQGARHEVHSCHSFQLTSRFDVSLTARLNEALHVQWDMLAVHVQSLYPFRFHLTGTDTAVSCGSD